ncbi:uncharacterized protein LOC141696404 [Apium graveolens]|uniref:uncharacterized protein LOC141696404 n=1 Tax=Apium graveolens TaxID=4045 RepID=UPI003D78B55A
MANTELRGFVGGIDHVNVYGPLNLKGKRQLWDEILKILVITGNDLVCIVGDFNSIMDEKESVNCTYRRLDVQGFNDFIRGNNLCEIRCSKLDRFLVTDNWFIADNWEVLALNGMDGNGKILEARKKSRMQENFQVMLKKFKLGLKQWCKGSKDKLDIKIKEVENILECIDRSHVGGEEVVKCQLELAESYKKRDSMLRQKERIHWNLQGDKIKKIS